MFKVITNILFCAALVSAFSIAKADHHEGDDATHTEDTADKAGHGAAMDGGGHDDHGKMDAAKKEEAKTAKKKKDAKGKNKG